jgi:hypothetical protein
LSESFIAFMPIYRSDSGCAPDQNRNGIVTSNADTTGCCSAVHFFTDHRNNPAIEFFFKRVNATVLLKPFKLKALDSTIVDVLRKVV